MPTLKTTFAIVLATLLLSTTVAGATSTLPQTNTPMTTPSNPSVDNNRPAPEFGIDDVVVKPILKINPYVVTCSYWGLHDKFGPEVGFFNKGTKTIPAGSIITLTMPDGTTYEIKVDQPVPPGGGIAIDGPDYADQPGFTCDATITWLSARSL